MIERQRQRSGASVAAMVLLLTSTACGSEEPEPSPTPAVEAVIDECLVGGWTSVSERQDVMIGTTPVVMVDGPRTLDFSADGREVVTYIDEPSVVQDATGKTVGTVTHEGTITYRVSTDQEGTISFVVEGGGGTSTFDFGGEPQTSTFDGTSDPVDYTCTDDILTQKSDGFEAEFERS